MTGQNIINRQVEYDVSYVRPLPARIMSLVPQRCRWQRFWIMCNNESSHIIRLSFRIILSEADAFSLGTGWQRSEFSLH